MGRVCSTEAQWVTRRSVESLGQGNEAGIRQLGLMVENAWGCWASTCHEGAGVAKIPPYSPLSPGVLALPTAAPDRTVLRVRRPLQCQAAACPPGHGAVQPQPLAGCCRFP